MCVISLCALLDFGVGIYDDVVRGDNEAEIRDFSNLCFNIIALGIFVYCRINLSNLCLRIPFCF